MKRRALLILVLTFTIALGAAAPAVKIFQSVSTTALADSATPVNSDRAEAELPMTDRIPWLIYVVLTSAVVALAWILFSLARAQMRNVRPTDNHQTKT